MTTRYSTTTAALLWLGWLFGFAGLHRIYLGKPVSGIIWFLTWGLFGFGQVIDLIRLRGMVEEKNLELEGRRARAMGMGMQRRVDTGPGRPHLRRNPRLLQAA